MLSPDHVRVRRRGNELTLLTLSGDLRERALVIASELASVARAHVGKSRAELEAAWEVQKAAPRERKLLAGLAKLVEDASDFESGDSEQAADLRREVFAAAAARRKEDDAPFDRSAVMAAVASLMAMRAPPLPALHSVCSGGLSGRGGPRGLLCLGLHRLQRRR